MLDGLASVIVPLVGLAIKPKSRRFRGETTPEAELPDAQVVGAVAEQRILHIDPSDIRRGWFSSYGALAAFL